MRVLNRVLPTDIRVLGWCPVPVGFSARFVYLLIGLSWYSRAMKFSSLQKESVNYLLHSSLTLNYRNYFQKSRGS